jgi:hypothetical protein
MANRQSGSAGSRRAVHTARVVVHRSALPGWFWGFIGFLSVLAVGFGVLIFAAKGGYVSGGAMGFGTASATPPPVAVPTAALPPAPSAPSGGPQIEQLAVPAPAPLPVVPEPKVKAPAAHPIKLARSPSPSGPKAAAPAVAAAPAEKPAAAADEPAKKPAEAAPPDDGRVHIHHAGASDSDDDDDSDN